MGERWYTTVVITRRDLIVAGATSGLILGVGGAPVQAAPAAPGEPTILDEATFRAHIATGPSVRHRQMIGAARNNDGAALQFAVNTLNGFANGWHEPAGSVQVVVVLFGSSCTLGLDDTAWKAHHLGDIVRSVKSDFLSVDAAQGNPWSHASTTLAPTADKSVPALLQRGVKIFVCNTALGEISTRIVAAGYAAGAADAFAVQKGLQMHVLPGCEIVPAGISAVSVLQESGYTFFTAAL